MKIKCFLSFALVLVLGLSLLAGCGSDSDKTDTASAGSDTDGIFFTGKVDYLTAEGESLYRIIRPEEDDDALAAAQYLFKQIKDTLGTGIKNQTDAEDGSDAYEILVGNTNRAETATAKQYLFDNVGGRYDDFIVCSIGKKIVIYAQSPTALDNAAKYFVENYLKADGVDGGILYTKATEGEFYSLTVNGVSIGRFSLIRPHFNSSYLTELEMRTLVDTVYSKTGYMLEILHDEYVEAADYEIIIGNTNREDVKTLTDYDAYSVEVKGNKVYLNGGSAHATAMAVSEFGKMLTGDIKDTSVTGSYATAIANYDETTTLRPTWGDDFDGEALDTTKWLQYTGNTDSASGENGKRSVRSGDPNDVYVRDGRFHICARQDEDYYYGGKIITKDIMTYKYGYVEMSALVPHGSDFWVALWASRGGSGSTRTDIPSNTDPTMPFWLSPEIDIMEMFGNSASYAANCHRWPTALGKEMGAEHTSLDGADSNAKKYYCPDGKLLGEDFHTYGMLWTAEAMTFVCDGDDYFTYTFKDTPEDQEAFHHEMYLIISMALGFDSNGASINDATEEQWQNTNKFIVDWVHIYQKNDGLSILMLY